MNLMRRFGKDYKNILFNRRRWSLVLYDSVILFIVDLIILGVYPSSEKKLAVPVIVTHIVLSFLSFYISRCICSVYRQVWRYGRASAYIRLIIADGCAGMLYFVLQTVLPVNRITFIHVFSIAAFNLLLTLGIRLLYQYLYEYAKSRTRLSGLAWRLFKAASGSSIAPISAQGHSDQSRIRIGIVGAGNIGVLLAEELLKNPHAMYTPCCFFEIDEDKIGREIAGIPVISNADVNEAVIREYGIREVVFALPHIGPTGKKALYDSFSKYGCKVKTYDYPLIRTAENGKRHMREFDIEELLFRSPVIFDSEQTGAYYRDKVVLITGGGGSIGSELCRQITKMQPKLLIILDIYENGAYDVQQELRMAYGANLRLQVEIVSVCDRMGFEQVFRTYHPDILIHAAAHKHVPLMEHNCCEAVKNNVFGTLNAVELCEKYGVSRFMMVSTDKAVNPTNVMGATKRMCEMIVQTHSRQGTPTVFSATRFGNVLGSAGSVIPLFKKQIQQGGPLTVTDKRIIRYFMTIPEATQLVLQSGAMAKNGDLFVLDMGSPVKILDLAENMIRLSGLEPYHDIDIVETGLRPGEKLYEELLIKSEELDKTENQLIFIERDEPLPAQELNEKLALLTRALETNDNENVKTALMHAIPTYHLPEIVNQAADVAEEMRRVRDKNEKTV